MQNIFSKISINKSILNCLLVVALINHVFPSQGMADTSNKNDGKISYAIIVTKAVAEDQDWLSVAKSLQGKYREKYNVSISTRDESLQEVLQTSLPQYACFIAKPEEVTREFLKEIWSLTRSLDDDPYGDVIWGVITGYTYKDALRLTQASDMEVDQVVSSTSIVTEYFKKAVLFDEINKNHWMVKKENQKLEDRNDAPDDTTHAIADELNNTKLFITSGHATELNWSIGYAYKNGFFVSKDGSLYGFPSNSDPFPIEADGSKIHIASGNCLLGHINDPHNCMALSLMRDAHVDMLVGYTVPTWFGYMGWGILDYYLEQPGRFSVAEAFFANNQALNYLLTEHNRRLQYGEANASDLSPQDIQGLLYDRDTVILYGDPAWQNGLAPQDSGWRQSLTVNKEDSQQVWTLTITPLKEEKTYNLLNGNGSQRSGRPIVQLFPSKIKGAKVVEGMQYNPVVTENFILIPLTKDLPTNSSYSIKIISED